MSGTDLSQDEPVRASGEVVKRRQELFFSHVNVQELETPESGWVLPALFMA